MKRWGLRILSAILTFTLGTGAAIIGWRCLKPVAIQPVRVVPGIDLQMPSLPPSEAVENRPPADEDEDSPPPNDTYKAIKPHPVLISPYQIKRFCDESRKSQLNLNSIWKKLNINGAAEAVTVFEAYGSCEAKISTIELNSRLGQETLLKLDFGMPELTVYLIFNHVGAQDSVKSQWNLLGYIPYSYGAPFIPPSEQVISDGQHRWLIIDIGIGHGSAFGTRAADWYEVGEAGVRMVLSYQNGIFIGLQNPSINREIKVLKCAYHDGTTTVVIQSSTSVESYDREIPEPFSLWTNKRNAVFTKRQGMRKFIFDLRHSALSLKEINPYYGHNSEISNEDILKYNQRDLARLAATGNEKQKEWLRNFLRDCDESTEKQSLQKLLEGAQP